LTFTLSSLDRGQRDSTPAPVFLTWLASDR
jgi:hypothetical protein